MVSNTKTFEKRFQFVHTSERGESTYVVVREKKEKKSVHFRFIQSPGATTKMRLEYESGDGSFCENGKRNDISWLNWEMIGIKVLRWLGSDENVEEEIEKKRDWIRKQLGKQTQKLWKLVNSFISDELEGISYIISIQIDFYSIWYVQFRDSICFSVFCFSVLADTWNTKKSFEFQIFS